MKSELSEFGFEPLDWQLASTLTAGVAESSRNLELAIMLASKRCREGHVCASLADVADLPLGMTEFSNEPTTHGLCWPPIRPWLEELSRSDLISRTEPFDPSRPLVLAGDHLYLTRYFLHETALGKRISERISATLAPRDPSAVRGRLESLFEPLHSESEIQRIAVAMALSSRLTVITGGPGTGKTTTIVKLLALLIEQLLSESRGLPRVILLAPTGKAATRIVESIRSSKERLSSTHEVKSAIPDTASTIHRALGMSARAGSSGCRPIPADIVIVDEASMVDLALMRRLFDACVNVERLVLLGDAEQLESVLAGSVLSELTARRHAGFSRPNAERLLDLTGLDVPSSGSTSRTLDDCRIELTVSHRFSSQGGIGRLAQAVRGGQSTEAWEILQSRCKEVRFIELGRDDNRSARLVLDIAEDGYRAFRAAATPQEAVDALPQFRILCGHRQGPLGMQAINGSLVESRRARYSPIPILITENATEVSLFNGDVGVLWPSSDRSFGQEAHVRTADGRLRSFSMRRLPAHEVAFATTVHKSQGSEVDRIAFVLPNLNSPLLTRELLYTAITRAKSFCAIIGTKAAFLQACERKSRRGSGLLAQLDAMARSSDAR